MESISYLKKKKLLIFILLSITIGSCYSIESDCVGIITINPNPLDFGDVLVNSPISKNITIQNSGTADLVISGISISNTYFVIPGEVSTREDAFTLQNAGTPITIAAGGSRTIDVQFLPIVARDYEGTVTLIHNASYSLSTVQLTGYGSYGDVFWELIPNSPTDVYRMACDANGNLWAVTYENGDVYLYNGTSWQQRGSVGRVVHAINVAPNGDIYTVGDLSLYRSTNGGTTWNSIFNVNKIESNELAEIVISHSGELYFATSKDVYVPDGSSWRRAGTNGLSGTLSYPIALAPNGTLYATETIPNSDEHYIVYSTDAGNSWLRSTGFSARLVYRLTVLDNNTIFVAAGYNGILKSTDGGRNWYPITEGGTAWDIIYNSKTGTLFADIDGYALSTCNATISTDLGRSWEVQNGGLRAAWVPGLGPYCFAFNSITGDTYLKVVSNYFASKWEGWVGRVYRYVQPIESSR